MGNKHPLYGKTHTEETLAKMAAAKLGKTTWLGKIHTEETKIKMRKAFKDRSNSIEVLNLETNEKTSYISIREAARALCCNHGAIRYGLNNPAAKPYKGKYKFLNHRALRARSWRNL